MDKLEVTLAVADEGVKQLRSNWNQVSLIKFNNTTLFIPLRWVLCNGLQPKITWTLAKNWKKQYFTDVKQKHYTETTRLCREVERYNGADVWLGLQMNCPIKRLAGAFPVWNLAMENNAVITISSFTCAKTLANISALWSHRLIIFINSNYSWFLITLVSTDMHLCILILCFLSVEWKTDVHSQVTNKSGRTNVQQLLANRLIITYILSFLFQYNRSECSLKW